MLTLIPVALPTLLTARLDYKHHTCYRLQEGEAMESLSPSYARSPACMVFTRCSVKLITCMKNRSTPLSLHRKCLPEEKQNLKDNGERTLVLEKKLPFKYAKESWCPQILSRQRGELGRHRGTCLRSSGSCSCQLA